MALHRSDRQSAGFTFVETVFAVAIVAGFFVALFSVSTQCLYFVNASRELKAAGQTAQSRLEQIRNCTWAQVTSSTYLQTLLTQPMSGASTLGTLTEVVTVNKYPTAVSPSITLTRTGTGVGNVTPTINSTNAAIASGDLVSINVQLTWTAAPGARSRSMGVATVYGKNTQ